MDRLLFVTLFALEVETERGRHAVFDNSESKIKSLLNLDDISPISCVD